MVVMVFTHSLIWEAILMIWAIYIFALASSGTMCNYPRNLIRERGRTKSGENAWLLSKAATGNIKDNRFSVSRQSEPEQKHHRGAAASDPAAAEFARLHRSARWRGRMWALNERKENTAGNGRLEIWERRPQQISNQFITASTSTAACPQHI